MSNITFTKGLVLGSITCNGFNFMIIIQVTNKVFIVFLPKEILLDTNTFLTSTSSKKYLLWCSTLFLSTSIFLNVKIP